MIFPYSPVLGNMYTHSFIRRGFGWIANSRIPVKELLVKDLSDSHLRNIITWVSERPNQYDHSTLIVMMNELSFRFELGIKVPEYDD